MAVAGALQSAGPVVTKATWLAWRQHSFAKGKRMNITHHRGKVLGAALLSVGLATSAIAGSAAADGDSTTAARTVSGQLNPLNESGVTGRAETTVRNRRIHVEVRAHNLAPDLPHAQHIHFGAKARHECPTAFDDTNGDFRLTTVEGLPAYGPVKVSLTTEGDTSADSVLAVDRYPTAPDGHVHYERTTRTKDAIARGIRRGNAVVVIHGVDYNNNGQYDFDSAGESDLNSELPAEATDPAACGVLTR